MTEPQTSQLCHVLVVDDDPAVLHYFARILSSRYAVATAASGDEALARAAVAPPDLVLVDFDLRGMDGFALMAALRERPGTAGVPVIFVADRAADTDEEAAFRRGAADFIAGPLRPLVVLARVRSQIEAKLARDIMTGHAALLEAEVARRMQETHLAQEVTIAALAGLAEARDRDTGMHLRRTQAYVELLGRRLMDHPRFAAALRDGGLERIVRAAPLHDLGKVAVPDAVLHKPGPLTSAEFAVIRAHPQTGSRAIDRAIAQTIGQAEAMGEAMPEAAAEAAFAFLRQASEIALSHHEKWDGTGYPAGLAGEEIPVSGRLMAVADVFDAITSRRIYKPALSIAEAEAVLLRGAGRHFDPDVVAAYVAAADAFRGIMLALADPADADIPEGHDPSWPDIGAVTRALSA